MLCLAASITSQRPGSPRWLKRFHRMAVATPIRQRHASLSRSQGLVQCGQFTPDGKRVITGDATGAPIFWDPHSSTPIFKLSAAGGRFGLTEGITSLAGGVRVINLIKGNVVGALGGHGTDEGVESIAFEESGAAAGGPGVVATGATDGKVCVWDLATMRLRATLEHSVHISTSPSQSGFKND